MQYREIGQSGIQASVVGLGAWAIGGGSWWGPTDDDESVRAIQAGLDAGINLIDTAPGYGWGRSEEVVGRAVKGRRDEVVLSTKCGVWWTDDRGAPFFEADGRKVKRCLRPETIREEVERSLQRLGTDRIDLYFTHWPAVEPDPTPITVTMECLRDLKQQGKIRAIGASNVSLTQMDEYRAAGVLDANQPRYSMLDRTIEAEVAPYCQQHRISICAYTPLEQGLLTGKIGMDRQLTDGDVRNSISWFKPANRQRVLDLLAGWADLTDAHHCTLSQLAIAWTVAQPGVTFALCGARKAEHVRENAVGGEIELTPEELARIRADVEALGKPA
jgi:methylglyoxal reductase